jgi:hypothetical protein
MKILKEPNNIVTCRYCEAVLQFNWDEVFKTETLSGKHGTKTHKAIKCPCCGSIVRVWEKENT